MATLKLRPLQITDGPEWITMLMAPNASALGWQPHDLTTARSAFEQVLMDNSGVAIELDSQMVGCMWLFPQVGITGFPDAANLEVSFLVAASWQEHGVMMNALAELLRSLREQGRVKSLIANVRIDNGPSKRVLQNQGFQLVGQFVNLQGDRIEQFEIKICK